MSATNPPSDPLSTNPDDYWLRITAGTHYDPVTHVPVPVNARGTPVELKGPRADIRLSVRISGCPDLLQPTLSTTAPPTDPTTAAYFQAPPHAARRDTFSISLWFTPKETDSSRQKDEPAEAGRRPGISGSDLQWGNSLDAPVRDQLPSGLINTALRILRWWVDPGLEGDAYADEPHLYGPALSSFNTVYVGGGDEADDEGGKEKNEDGDAAQDGCDPWISEGGTTDGLAVRRSAGCPDVGQADEDPYAASAARQKWALTEAAKSRWVFEFGRPYGLDFFNGFIDFQKLAVRLPGFQLALLPYWRGQKVRYVLRNRTTEEVYLVVEMSLVPRKRGQEKGNPEDELVMQPDDVE